MPRSWSCYDIAGRHHRPVRAEKSPPDDPRVRADAQHRRAAARRTRSGSASTPPAAPVVVVTMADGCDDPRQIDELARLVDRGVVVAAASPLHARRPAGRRAVAQGRSSRAGPGAASAGSRGSAPATPPTPSRPTTASSSARSASSPGPGSRSASSWPRRRARLRLPVAEIPTIWLDRQLGESNFDLGRLLPSYLRWYFSRSAAADVEQLARRWQARREAVAVPYSARPVGDRSGHGAAEETSDGDGAGHRLRRLHRWLPRRGAAGPRPRGGRARQLLEVRPGRAQPTTTTRATASSRATPATSVS